MKSLAKDQMGRIAALLKQRRIAMQMKQSDAALRAGISLGSLRTFEQSGEISLERFLKLCAVYRMDKHVIAAIENREWWSLEEIQRAEQKKTVR